MELMQCRTGHEFESRLGSIE